MNEDKIIQKLIDHDGQLEAINEDMAKREDVRQIRTTMDEAMVILRRLDQERIFTVEWIRRLEKEVEEHSKQLQRVKEELKLA